MANASSQTERVCDFHSDYGLNRPDFPPSFQELDLLQNSIIECVLERLLDAIEAVFD